MTGKYLRSLLLIGIVAGPVLASGLVGVMHDPPRAVHAGQPVPIEVRLEGPDTDLPQVTLHYRMQGGSSYQYTDLAAVGENHFTGQIPEEATRGLAVKYYIEINHPEGAYRSRIGSEDYPISVQLLEPVKPEQSNWMPQAGLWLAGVGFVAGGLSYRTLRRRRRITDQLFWARTLGPLLQMRGEVARAGVDHLAGITLAHPTRGSHTFSREEILSKLAEMRNVDRDELERAGESLGLPGASGHEKESLSANVISEGIGPLAADVGRLCSAAWFLSDRDAADSDSIASFLQPFEDARRDVRDLQKAMERKEMQTAGRLLDKLTRRSRGLKQIIAQADFECSADELAHRLDRGMSTTVDALGSLLEYYALVAIRSGETGKKLLVVGAAIARHDQLDGTSPSRIRESLRRRKLMRAPGAEAPLPEMRVSEAGDLRSAIIALGDSAESDLDEMHARIDTFLKEVGPQLYTLAGVAEGVALNLTLARKRSAIDRTHVGSFDSIVSDLASVGKEDVQQDEIDEPAEHEDSAAIEMLRSIEAELRIAVSEGNYEERGIYLAPTEVSAVDNEAPEDAAWSAAVVRSAACRTALDRFAQRHARSHQPDGQDPPPIPTETARTLEGRAQQLGRDMQDSIERDLMRGHHTRAKATTLLVHRLSRARTGLVLLAKLTDDE